MKVKLAICMIMVGLIFGCATNGTLGDGKIDEVESATIRVAVGLAMSIMPETVQPAYTVSSYMVDNMDWNNIVSLADLEGTLESQIDMLELTPAEKQSVNDLVVLIRAKIRDQLDLKLPEHDLEYYVVVKKVVEIVYEASRARIGQ